MLRAPERSLSPSASGTLRGYQAEIDALETFPERVAAARTRFRSRNRQQNAAFQEVRETLAEMCGGVRRCMYCEDSMADEIEHVKPKVLYPGSVFVWRNFLYACGPCNGGKGSCYCVFSTTDRRVLNVARRRGQAVEPPPPGDPLLIDPRCEDPLHFLQLELRTTFHFVPRAARETETWQRARRTIEVLDLNRRGVLPEARKAAFHSFFGLLDRYRSCKGEGASTAALGHIRSALVSSPHPTVWAEMKRQRGRFPKLETLFADVPEALGW